MIKPDFLITPYIVKKAIGMHPSDGDIYAVVYWFEHMKDGRCTASNETLAEVAVLTTRAVRASLERLEKKGFIQRVYDGNKRKEIRALIHFMKERKQNHKREL